MLYNNTRFNPTPLTNVGAKPIRPANNIKGWTTLVRGILTAAEVLTTIGLTALAPVSGGASLALEAGTSLLFAGANELVDNISGQASVFGSSLNWGLALGGTVLSGVGNVRAFNKGINSTIDNLDSIPHIPIVKIGDFELAASPTMAHNIAKQASTELKNIRGNATFFNKFLTGTSPIKKVQNSILNSYTKTLNKYAYTFTEGVASKHLENLAGKSLKSGLTKGIQGVKFADNLERNIREQTYGTLFTNSDKAIRLLKEFDDLVLRSVDKIDTIRLLKVYDELRDLARIDDLRKIIQGFKETTESIISAAAKKGITGQYINKSAFLSQVREINKHIWRQTNTISRATKNPLLYNIQATNRWLGGNTFSNITQGAQLIDPQDLGRAPIELTYKFLRKKIRQAFGKVSKVTKSLNTAFIKSGGMNLDSSWIVGYKIIRKAQTPIDPNIVMIHFIPEATQNKAPVIVMATNKELKAFKNSASPGRYYLNRWALSKGQKVTSVFNLILGETKQGAEGVATKLRVLSLLPIGGIRNVLSIISNWVENINDIVQGDYGKNWTNKLLTSMRNSAISRTFRLFSSTVAAGALEKLTGKAGLSKIIGKELQRVGTTIFKPIILSTIDGKKMMNLKQLGKQLGKNLAVSVRSYGLKKYRKVTTSNVLGTRLSVGRKLYQLQRIPNAVTPGRKINFKRLTRYRK